jgi:hypothetical protein
MQYIPVSTTVGLYFTEEESAALDFHSVRLEERFVRAMETLIQQPDASIWVASKDRTEASD